MGIFHFSNCYTSIICLISISFHLFIHSFISLIFPWYRLLPFCLSFIFLSFLIASFIFLFYPILFCCFLFLPFVSSFLSIFHSLSKNGIHHLRAVQQRKKKMRTLLGLEDLRKERNTAYCLYFLTHLTDEQRYKVFPRMGG